MKKFFFVAVALVALAAPSAALADAPNGQLVSNENAKSNGSIVGVWSSQVIQNGQLVSEQENRGALVQGYHLLDGKGSLAK